MTPIDIQVSRSKVSVEGQAYSLYVGEGGISVLQTSIFDLVTLTLKFDHLFKNFNLGHNFQIRRARAFILHMCIPCDKTFCVIP